MERETSKPEITVSVRVGGCKVEWVGPQGAYRCSWLTPGLGDLAPCWHSECGRLTPEQAADMEQAYAICRSKVGR